MPRLYRWVTLWLLWIVTNPAPAQQPLGDPLPARALLRLGTARFKANGGIRKLAFSADGAALYSEANSIQKWDVKTGALLETWPITYGDLIDLSPDGRWMLVGSFDRPPDVVDTRTGKLVRRLHRDPTSLARFAPDGKHVLCALDDEKTLVLRDFVTGVERGRFEGAVHRVRILAFSPDGKLIAASEHTDNLWDGTIHVMVWETATGKLRTQITSSYQGLTYDLAFTPDNRRLIVGSQQRVRVFDAQTGKSLYVLGHQTRGNVVVDPKGRTCVAGGEGILWDLQNDAKRGRLETPHEPIGALAISHDGKTIASANASVHHHTIDLWDADTGQRKTVGVRHRAEVEEVAFSPDCKSLATRSPHDGTLHLWDAQTGQAKRSFHWGTAPTFVYGTFGFTSKNTFLTAGGRRWLTTGQPLDDLLDLADRKERLENTGADRRDYQIVEVSPDGRHAADLDMRRRVRIWDLRDKRVLFRIEPLSRLSSPQAPIRYTFTPDSKSLVVSHTYDPGPRVSSIRVFDTATGKARASYRPEAFDVYRLLCTADGERLIVSTRNGIEMRNLATGEVLKRWPRDPLPEPRSTAVALSQDGRMLAFESAQGELTLLETATGKAIDAWPTKSAPVRAIAFSYDGRRLLTGNQDSSALLWSLSDPADSARLLKTKTDGQLWDALAGDTAQAYAAVFALATSPERASAVLAERLPAAPTLEQQQILQWIKDQSEPAFVKRDEAAKQLRQRGAAVAPYLRAALKEQHALETRRRLEELLRAVEVPGLSPERLREERALQILEMLGTPEARRLLAALAQGAAGSPRTTSARAALMRLRER